MCFLKKCFYCSTFQIKVCDPSQISFGVLCEVNIKVQLYSYGIKSPKHNLYERIIFPPLNCNWYLCYQSSGHISECIQTLFFYSSD